jgi:hypothetical protein
MMPKPVCVKCQRFFKPKKNGVVLCESMPAATGAEPGTIDPTAWKPYKVWMADLSECEGCGTQIIAGFAFHPAAEQHEDRFAEAMKYITHTVNDC